MFKLNVDNLKHIYDVCAGHVEKGSSYRPIAQCVQLIVENGVCTATAVNGLSLGQTRVSVYITEGETVDEGTYLIPVVKIPKTLIPCTIENTDTEMIIDFGSVKFCEKKPSGEFIDWKRCLEMKPKEPKYAICVNPRLLINSLNSLKGETFVKIIFGEPTAPFFIESKSGNENTLVLPARGW